MTDIQRRIADILGKHYLWDECDGKNGHIARCRCDVDDPSITNSVPDGGWMPFAEYTAHVSEVLVSELGLTEETDQLLVQDPGKICANFRRYVTEWVRDA